MAREVANRKGGAEGRDGHENAFKAVQTLEKREIFQSLLVEIN